MQSPLKTRLSASFRLKAAKPWPKGGRPQCYGIFEKLKGLKMVNDFQ
jgi:hypothetical protein